MKFYFIEICSIYIYLITKEEKNLNDPKPFRGFSISAFKWCKRCLRCKVKHKHHSLLAAG